MKFRELTEEEYKSFWENHPLKTFLSAVEISKLREKSNWNTNYVGVEKNNKIIAATMLLSHIRRFNKYEFYSPRGYLLDFNNKELVDYFTNELKKYIKEKNGYVLRIDPYVIYKERDIDGNIKEGGIDNSNIVNNLLSLGFKKVSIPNTEQVLWMFALDLEGKDEDTILKEMQSSTRNKIRKTEKYGIELKELKYDELNIFQDIMDETSKRKGFSNRKIEYYQKMYNIYKEDVKYLIAELNLLDYIKKLEEEKEEKTTKYEKMDDVKDAKAKSSLLNEIESIDKRLEEAKTIGKDKIVLSCAMFILTKPEIIFLAGGNYEEYMKYDAQYLLQWEMIKYGINNKYKRHNFYGIPANINTHPKDYGIYEFKRRFNGYVEELIGEYELPITWHYSLFKLIHKIKK
ncbi:MAG: peptidoglycan bridge formation glycyltransferase FemA/FemB family protein [Bacilli bacterium]|nr:peptidoglycan bridge formation glycyltransferase FemA/FemB family protein [Bacilli bacterium]